jgi:hypothetical protein
MTPSSRPGRAVPSGKEPTVHTGQEAGWAPEPFWTQRLQKKILYPCMGSYLDRPVVQPVARHLGGGGGLVPKRGCLLTSAYHAFPDDMSLESDGGMI